MSGCPECTDPDETGEIPATKEDLNAATAAKLNKLGPVIATAIFAGLVSILAISCFAWIVVSIWRSIL